jgi:hypothetical protein
MTFPSTEAAIHTHHHAVQFYGNEQSLFTTVAGFLGEGLISGQPAIVEHLCGRLIDCESARRSGSLLLLDAEDTLGQFMVGDAPDPDLFEQNVGRLIRQIVDGRGRPLVRAYGEMVDVLWKQGRPEAAIKLEILWNKLALKHRFALLCGYAMGNFYKQARHLEDVCAQHTQLLPHDTNDAKVIVFEPSRHTA